ncbi:MULTISPECIES: DUF1841 family protein [Leptospirillum]|jgi:ribosomal 50S subunit-associated protein YjgA (DUF615 family)|uniref:DUF1841 domain-containing protein n=3 Tax=Leptospirillum ferriphilum TaxID=178606 RepID=A0A059Y184_9BACT|nr:MULTISPECIES: DUF1841 family protein [Leptospirillum]EAY58119.1 MAG: protein of unknown function [Leptospirillum rubarum]EIJ76519.1 MAG: hypothetical protein C75L2_00180012 [Leptospirillum sp. Group II 'C75']AFS54608.1 hypothetical protein LFML04_2419 [Leptospirillum ferriphilum ML-04]AIA31271.1 hypothetical protein Y981_12580 [Leptospirillum ferriphilum YSK]AKS24506.1 hypothetical protein ABH19_13185 [Leptospirillum sp. Group II 'CF-1']
MKLFDQSDQWRFSRIAEKRKTTILEGEDARIAAIMEEHPEFDPFWSLGEASASPQEIQGQIVNPFVHITLHLQIQNQIEREFPQEVKQAFLRLVEQGESDHEAIHQIISVYANLYFKALRRGQSFDESEYSIQLKYLTAS